MFYLRFMEHFFVHGYLLIERTFYAVPLELQLVHPFLHEAIESLELS